MSRVQITFRIIAPFDVTLSSVDPTSKQEKQFGTWHFGQDVGQGALPGTEWRFTAKGHRRPFQTYVTTDAPTQLVEVGKRALYLNSFAFEDDGQIPSKYTCDGQAGVKDVSPPLAWTYVPAEAKSLVLIVDEPDATDGDGNPLSEPWVHWVLYNIPPSDGHLAEGQRQLPAGTLEGVNSWGQTGYRGPCPSSGSGRHDYFHRLYALDTVFPDLGRPSEAKIWEQVRRGPSRIIASAELVGTYQRAPAAS